MRLTRRNNRRRWAVPSGAFNVQSAEYIPQRWGLEQYKEELGEDGYLLEGPGGRQPPAGRLPGDHAGYLKTHRDRGAAAADHRVWRIPTAKRGIFLISLIQIRRVVNIICYTLIAMLGAVSIFIISQHSQTGHVRPAEEDRHYAYGGRHQPLYTDAPFIVEGLSAGRRCSPAFVAFGLDSVVYNYLAERVHQCHRAGRTGQLFLNLCRASLAGSSLGGRPGGGVGGSVLTIRGSSWKV